MATRSVGVPVTNLWERPDAVLDIDHAMTGPRPDPPSWVAALDNEQKLALRGRLGSQLLLGEPVEVVRQEGDLSLVVATWQPSRKDPRGYPGWVRTDHLSEPQQARADTAVVTTDAAPLRDHDLRLSFGTILPVRERGPEQIVVELPGGGKGALAASDCVVRPTGERMPVEPERVAEAAGRFVGLEYLWGGTSSYGLDCSGLVHLCFRALGRVVPRDAHDQSDAAEHLDRGQARDGDLYFFARPGKGIHHVGLALPGQGPEHLLHAPQTGRGVVAEPMSAERTGTLLDYVGRFAS